MEDGEWRENLREVPQRAVASPILPNIYLHYVLDLWLQRKWRTRVATGETIIAVF